jgi:hypothetical protein
MHKSGQRRLPHRMHRTGRAGARFASASYQQREANDARRAARLAPRRSLQRITIMKHFFLAALTSLSMMLAACAVDPQDPTTPDDEADVTQPGDATEAPAGLKELPAELSLTTNVPAGCSAEVNCTGAKTCTAWSAYYQCGQASYGCAPICGIPGRGSACYPATFTPQNRSRTCTIRATGATCVEVDYRLSGATCTASE